MRKIRFKFEEANLLGGSFYVEWRHCPRDGLVDVDALLAGDAAALAVDAGDVGRTGAGVAVDAVLAGPAVETPFYRKRERDM